MRAGPVQIATFLAWAARCAYAIQLSPHASASPQCPQGSDVFTVSASAKAPGSSFSRVMMADYPSAGSTWLKDLLTAAAAEQELGSPSCTIYGNEGGTNIDAGLYCPKNWTRSMGSALVKSHFPAQEVFKLASIRDDQFDATMKFDKLLILVRHPVALVNSNIHRWSGSPSWQADNLECWGQWWKRVAGTVGAEKVHMVRYEDLCHNTAENLLAVLKFLGGQYAEISSDSVQRMLERHHELACIHAGSLDRMAAVKTEGDRIIVDKLKELMPVWGYHSGAEGEFDEVLLAGKDKNLMDRELASREYENPWSSVWQV